MQDVLWYSICIATRSLIWLIGSQCIVCHCFRNPNFCKCSQKHPLCSRQNHLGPEWWTGSKQIEKKFKHTPVPTLWGKSWLGYPLRCQKCHVAKTRLTTSPNSRAKAISHLGFVWETYVFDFFWIPQLVGIACGSIRSVVWRIWHKVHWAQSMPCFCCCLIHPFLDWTSITTGLAW